MWNWDSRGRWRLEGDFFITVDLNLDLSFLSFCLRLRSGSAPTMMISVIVNNWKSCELLSNLNLNWKIWLGVRWQKLKGLSNLFSLSLVATWITVFCSLFYWYFCYDFSIIFFLQLVFKKTNYNISRVHNLIDRFVVFAQLSNHEFDKFTY